MLEPTFPQFIAAQSGHQHTWVSVQARIKVQVKGSREACLQSSLPHSEGHFGGAFRRKAVVAAHSSTLGEEKVKAMQHTAFHLEIPGAGNERSDFLAEFSRQGA